MSNYVIPGLPQRFCGGFAQSVPGVAETLQVVDLSAMTGWPSDGKGVTRLVISPSAAMRIRFATARISDGAPAAVADTSAAIGAANAKFPLLLLASNDSFEVETPPTAIDGLKWIAFKSNATSGSLYISAFR